MDAWRIAKTELVRDIDEKRVFLYYSGQCSSGLSLQAFRQSPYYSFPPFLHHMLTIRLSRMGKKKQPVYRFIVLEKSKDPWGKFLENLGTMNPLTSPATIDLKEDRVKYWIEKGAQPSDTVWNLLVDRKVVEGEKRLKVKISKRHKERLAKKQTA